MDSVKHSIAELAEQFKTGISELQSEMKSSTSVRATGPTSNINPQLDAFKSFVLTALENLQRQVELLSRQSDELEMRTRRKILLVHGIPEAKNEKTSDSVVKILSEQLQMPELTSDSFRTTHRLGQPNPDRPRAILAKFREASLRDKVWYSKKTLKGSGITLSEFLTKSRHMLFQTARQRFGVNKCWTKDGTVIIMGPDGLKHRVYSKADLDSIYSSTSSGNSDEEAPPTVSVSPPTSKDSKLSQMKTRRNLKK